MEKVYDYYRHYEWIRKNPAQSYPPDLDEGLRPATVIVNPTDPMFGEEHQLQRTTNFSVCRTPGGRIFQSYFSANGHAAEDSGNWIMGIASDDGAQTFRNMFVVYPPNVKSTRVADGIFWLDPKGRMWFLYCQTYHRMDGRGGVWAIVCDDPDAETLSFSEPRRLCDGVITEAPIVLKDGRWMFAAYLLDPSVFNGDTNDDMDNTFVVWLPEKIGVSVYVSDNEGETFTPIVSGLKYPYGIYENSLVERNDGSLMILMRGMNCTGHTFSFDGGFTWTPVTVNGALPLPNTHFCLRRLKSGNLLLVANYKANLFSYFIGRNNLTALISTDGGHTWGDHCLLLDEREGSEQPGCCEGDDGFIYIGYGRAPQLAGESLLAIVTEEDILAGRLVNPKSRLKITTGRSTGMRFTEYYPEIERIARKNGIEL